MQAFESRVNQDAAEFKDNAAAMAGLVARLNELQDRAVRASSRARDLFDKRGQLLPRERLGLLLDPGTPFLELMALAGFCGNEDPDPETSIPGAAVITGIGTVCGRRVAVSVSDSGIRAGAMQQFTSLKVMRCQEIALRNKLPFLQLVESGGGDLTTYRVERFITAGAVFGNLARLSASGLPVITAVHGSSTAGGAYLPGLSDYVVMVRGRSRAFLAGPPLVKAATGEDASEEELGGADMHGAVSGLADLVVEDDAQAIEAVRTIVATLAVVEPAARPASSAPLLDAGQLLGIMPTDFRKPVDMREVVARLADASELLEFRPDYGPHTVCLKARVEGHPTAFIANNGPLDPPGATKAAQFIQLCDQAGTPIVYLQNTTGFLVGRATEEAGMIKHGAKMIQALTNAGVPQVTIMCGASFGAGNYGMCGRGMGPRFVFSWPNARSAVMGGDQAARTMAIVREASAARRGVPVDAAALEREKRRVSDNIEQQAGAFHTSGLLLDDGVIDPRDTRAVLCLVLAVCREAAVRVTRPVQYGVARL